MLNQQRAAYAKCCCLARTLKMFHYYLLRLAPIHVEKEREKYHSCNNNGTARKVERMSTYHMYFNPIELVKTGVGIQRFELREMRQLLDESLPKITS